MWKAGWTRLIAFSVALAVTQLTRAQSAKLGQAPRPMLVLRGEGAQVYACETGPNGLGGMPSWNLVGPDADLLDAGGKVVGHHAAGPVWRLQDGTAVYGTVVSKMNALEVGAVPWLVLRAIRWEGEGPLRRVTTIRREQTHGGTAPGTGCDARHVGEQRRVPYTAVYTFYDSAASVQYVEPHDSAR